MRGGPELLQIIERKCSSIRMDTEELLIHCRSASYHDACALAVLDAELTVQGALLALRLARNEYEARAIQAAE